MASAAAKGAVLAVAFYAILYALAAVLGYHPTAVMVGGGAGVALVHYGKAYITPGDSVRGRLRRGIAVLTGNYNDE